MSSSKLGMVSCTLFSVPPPLRPPVGANIIDAVGEEKEGDPFGFATDWCSKWSDLRSSSFSLGSVTQPKFSRSAIQRGV